MIPGMNLLKIVFGAIAQQQLQYFESTGRVVGEDGRWETVYADPVAVRASWQPVEPSAYADLGLDLMRTYYYGYMELKPKGAERGDSPDRFTWSGRLYEVQQVTPWQNQDGWSYCRCVDIGPVA